MKKTALAMVGAMTLLSVSALAIMSYSQPHNMIHVVVSEAGVPIRISHTKNGIPVKFVDAPNLGIPVVIVDENQDKGVLVYSAEQDNK